MSDPVQLPVLSSPEQRIAIVRSLIQQRKPSERLSKLIRMAVDGASRDAIYAADAER